MTVKLLLLVGSYPNKEWSAILVIERGDRSVRDQPPAVCQPWLDQGQRVLGHVHLGPASGIQEGC